MSQYKVLVGTDSDGLGSIVNICMSNMIFVKAHVV